MMKKIGIVVSSIILLLTAAGCGSSKAENQAYVRTVEQKLASFSDSANAFSDCLAEINTSSSLPTQAQLDEAEQRLDALSAVCGEIAALSAPEKYAGEQEALRGAMNHYQTSLEKCRALLAFFRGYDEEIRSYPTPQEGSQAMRQKAQALYEEFAVEMREATQSLHRAVRALEAKEPE